MNNEENEIITTEENGSTKNIIPGVIFIVWFIASIVAIMILSKYNGYYTVMVFGQYFFVFGMIPLTQEKGTGKLIAIPFIAVGLAMVVIPYLMLHPELFSVTIIWDSVIPLLMILVFVIAGLAMIIISIIKNKKLKKVCTETVFATIISHDYTYNKGKRLYCPIYSFEFNNQKYEVSNNQYSNIGFKSIGTVLKLKINPNNPNEFLDNRNFHLFTIILGVCFLLMSVPTLIYILSTFEFIQ